MPPPPPQPVKKLHWGWHAALVLALCAPPAAFLLAHRRTHVPAPHTAQTASPPASAASAASLASAAASVASLVASAAPAASAPDYAAYAASLPPPSGDPLAAAEAMALVNARASKMVLTAVQLLGTPYRWGGKTQDGGFDCSGLVRAVVMQAAGMELPLNAAGQAWVTRPVPFHEVRPGDLVFFNTRGPVYSHVGIYVGDGFFIHAPHSGAVVRIEDMRQEKWMRRLTGTHRLPLMRPVLPASAAASAAASDASSAASMVSSPASNAGNAAQ